ncbi:lysine N(6)-hydroxylase/L-ornithine N(5)-oxygenase family protein [Salimicrobium humidisoli]|uniref:L-lysine N6-monooxygenase MbtG n=1 Tax=Salimicrobium humidisoli TaxID=2029857 RepID=A0ABX4HW87_9BACI|nr:SidA/IucD/PvdA family monooxygenase [Salimicrobium humidisoli]PBB07104.1 lysine 6-monooxygenase [Salimicrobium humidisoli]
MKQNREVYDVIGVGIGPFNLSLAALLDTQETKALFFEQKPEFAWHPGMLIEGTKLQVPFLADLVTMADPTNPHSFLNYISQQGRMYQFYILQRLDIPRREYNDYCKWASERIGSCRFGKQVTAVHGLQDGRHQVDVQDASTGEVETFYTKHVVLGTGSTPALPEAFQNMPREDVFHTADFEMQRQTCREAESVTVVGSGQSAAEAFRELLKEQRTCGFRLDWITRSPGFASMEESKLNLEHFSPDYIDYFYPLPQEKKDEIFASQGLYYKGISEHTITDIYNLMYEYTVGREKIDVSLLPLTKVTGIERKEGRYELSCHHYQKEEGYSHRTDKVIVATGYQPNVPSFIKELSDVIEFDDYGRYKVTKDYRLVNKGENAYNIFANSCIAHTHGVGSTNLGLAVFRSKVIVNQLLGKEVYPVQDSYVFQSFE